MLRLVCWRWQEGKLPLPYRFTAVGPLWQPCAPHLCKTEERRRRGAGRGTAKTVQAHGIAAAGLCIVHADILLLFGKRVFKRVFLELCIYVTFSRKTSLPTGVQAEGSFAATYKF